MPALYAKKWLGVVIALVAVGVANVALGWQGAAGMAIGIAGSYLNLYGWWRILKLMGDEQARLGRPPTPIANAVGIIAFFLKLPILIGLWFGAKLIGGMATSCFLVGLGLVYLGLIGWVLARSQGP